MADSGPPLSERLRLLALEWTGGLLSNDDTATGKGHDSLLGGDQITSALLEELTRRYAPKLPVFGVGGGIVQARPHPDGGWMAHDWLQQAEPRVRTIGLKIVRLCAAMRPLNVIRRMCCRTWKVDDCGKEKLKQAVEKYAETSDLAWPDHVTATTTAVLKRHMST